MFGMIGIVVTFAMVFGGYILAGGKLGVILHSLPFEMMMIGGAAAGSFLLSNETAVIKHALAGLGRSLNFYPHHECHPCLGYGCRTAGQIRTSGGTNGHGRNRRGALAATSAP